MGVWRDRTFAAKREETGAVRNPPLMEGKERMRLATDAAKKVPRALDERPANGCHVWTAPLVKGFFAALRTSRVRSCLRPDYAGRTTPLALMIVRVALRPHHRIALAPAQTLHRAFRAFPLVHITPWSPLMLIAFRRELSSTLLCSGRDRPLVVFAALGEQRKNDSRDLVGERDRRQLEFVFHRLAIEHRARPAA
jgi:hypothetical protein